jgi:outer membrane protein TolC
MILQRTALILLLSLCTLFSLEAQPSEKILSLEEVVKLACEQSPSSMLARHRFRASYWQHRTYLASMLPSLSLSTTLPEYNKSIGKVIQPDGTELLTPFNKINSLGSLSLTQKIPFTGGTISVESEMERIDQLQGEGKGTSYLATPVSIMFSQPLFSYNQLGWSRKIEPLRYEEAKKNYVSSMEQVSIQAIEFFFDLASAQINLEIARTNYSNNDTLYKIALGRYNIGTIAENELLQMELGFLNAGTRLNEANIDLEFRKSKLRSFLGFNENVSLRLIIPRDIPTLQLDYNKTLEAAMKNNPQVITMERQLIEAESDVAQARAERGLNTSIFARYGINQRAPTFSDVYNNPVEKNDMQLFTLGLTIPLLDWGQGHGRVKMAKSSEEVVRTQVEQNRTDFQQNVFLQVMQFNLQDDQLKIAMKADTIGTLRYEVTKQRFLIGKIDVLDLNVALTEKDEARRRYVEAVRNYWSFLYNIRKLTLFDFINDQPLEPEDGFDSLLD